MAGIYIHIPFCKSRCLYCDFYATTQQRLIEPFVEALEREIELRAKPPFTADTIQTVYWGGGTPSRLTPSQLERIVSALRACFSIAPDAEWTIEANPDDLTPSYCQALKQLGFNRLSIGIQSFQDRELRIINRRHNASEAEHAVKVARESGFDNISIDLIFALPEQTVSTWQETIERAVALHPEHISAYSLTYEEETPLTRLWQKGKIAKQPETFEIEAYRYLSSVLRGMGYEHYEVSNYALPGFRSRHNSSYWHRVPYLGLGPSAHSYVPECRSANVADVAAYICSLEAGNLPIDFTEMLSPQEVYEESVMLGLRTMQGVNLAALSEPDRTTLLQRAAPYLANGALLHTANHLKASADGLLLIDGIIAALF